MIYPRVWNLLPRVILTLNYLNSITMNKLKLIALFLVLGAGVAAAQSVNKPVKGDRLFELSATGINNLSTGLNTTRGGLMIRDFTGDNKARRLAANVNFILDTDSGGNRRFNEISLA